MNDEAPHPARLPVVAGARLAENPPPAVAELCLRLAEGQKAPA